MVRIWLLAAVLVLGAAFPLAAHGERPGEEKHDELLVKLSEKLVDAGKFRLAAPNITPDVETGAGTWTEA